MSWISWLVGKSDNGLVKQVVDGVGQFVHTSEEKAQAQAQHDQEITQRWQSDNEAPITRLVRPVSYLFVTIITFTFGALDASLEGFTISQGWLDLYVTIYVTMTIAYFGSRGLEKVQTKKKS